MLITEHSEGDMRRLRSSKALREGRYVHVPDDVALFHILVIFYKDKIIKEVFGLVFKSYVWLHAVEEMDIDISYGCKSDVDGISNVPPRWIVIRMINYVVVRIHARIS